MHSIDQLKEILQNDLMEFLKILNYNKKNNPVYFSSILLPFYLEQKSLGKIPKTTSDFIEDNIIYGKEYDTDSLKQKHSTQDDLNISKKINSNESDSSNSLTEINQSKNDINFKKFSSNELKIIAKTNYKYFKVLADYYLKNSRYYYNDVVYPILNSHKKRKMFLWLGIIMGAIIFFTAVSLFVNSKLEESEKRYILASEEFKKENDYEKKKVKEEEARNLRRFKESQKELDTERQEKLDTERQEKEYAKSKSHDGWEYIGTVSDDGEYYISLSDFHKTDIGANIWVKRICNGNCGTYQGSSIISTTSYCEYDFKNNSLVISMGHLHLVDGRDITQYAYERKEKNIVSGSIGEKIIRRLKNMRK